MMMACRYCGGAFEAEVRSCGGCGSPRPAPKVEAMQIGKIGRAVGRRDREAVLSWLESHMPAQNETVERCWTRRGAKALLALGVLVFFPQLLFFGLALGMLFAFWVYLPYRGIRLLLEWIAK